MCKWMDGWGKGGRGHLRGRKERERERELYNYSSLAKTATGRQEVVGRVGVKSLPILLTDGEVCMQVFEWSITE